MRSSLLTLVTLAGALFSSSAHLNHRLISTPPPPLAGRGPSPGEASQAAISQLCNDLSTELGSDKVVHRGISLDILRYTDSNSYYYSAVNQDQNPLCVVYPSSPADVQRTYDGIRRTKAAFAVVSGGHNPNWGWNSTPGVLIDVRNMRKIHVNRADGTVDLGPGLRWGEVYSTLEAQGLTVMGGRLSNVGLSALYTGGLSHLANRHGFGAEAIVSATVVLPSGQLVFATRHNAYRDLLWGLGAAGNQLGIVCEVTVKSFPVGEWWGGIITYVGKEAFDAVHDAVMNYTSRFGAMGEAASRTAMIPTFTWLATPVTMMAKVLVVNNGPSRPKGVFDELFSIPHLLDETRGRSFAGDEGISTLFDFGALPVVSAYTYNVDFQTFSYRSSRSSGARTIAALHDLAAEQLLRYTTITYAPEQVSQAGIRAGLKTSGGEGTPYGLSENDGDIIFSTLSVNSLPVLPTSEKQALLSGIKDMIEGGKVTDEKDLPLFVSYSAPWQSALLRARGFLRLKGIKAKYDATNLLVRLTNGPAFKDASNETAKPKNELINLGLPGGILTNGI